MRTSKSFMIINILNFIYYIKSLYFLIILKTLHLVNLNLQLYFRKYIK